MDTKPEGPERPDSVLLERYWSALIEAVPEFASMDAWQKCRMIELARELNTAASLEEFIAFPVAERRRIQLQAETEAQTQRAAEVAAIFEERRSIEPGCPAPCVEFVADAEARGHATDWRRFVAAAAYGKHDLLFMQLRSLEGPGRTSLATDSHVLAEVLPGITAERLAGHQRQLARDLWHENRPRFRTLTCQVYLDTIRRLNEAQLAQDAELHRRCRNCRESRRVVVSGPGGDHQEPCTKYEPHEHWDCLNCHGRGTVPLLPPGETVLLADVQRVPCTEYVHGPHSIEPSGDFCAKQEFHDRLEALFPASANAGRRATLYRELLLLLDHWPEHEHVGLCWWANDIAGKLDVSERDREPFNTRRYREPWPTGSYVAARAVILHILDGGPIPRTWQQASDMIERERRDEELASALDRGPRRASDVVAEPSRSVAPSTSAEQRTETAASESFPRVDWRRLSPDERQRRLGHALSLVRSAENAGRDPPSWRALERETGTTAKKLKQYPELVEAMNDAERAAHERHAESLGRNATRR